MNANAFSLNAESERTASALAESRSDPYESFTSEAGEMVNC